MTQPTTTAPSTEGGSSEPAGTATVDPAAESTIDDPTGPDTTVDDDPAGAGFSKGETNPSIPDDLPTTPEIEQHSQDWDRLVDHLAGLSPEERALALSDRAHLLEMFGLSGVDGYSLQIAIERSYSYSRTESWSSSEHHSSGGGHHGDHDGGWNGGGHDGGWNGGGHDGGWSGGHGGGWGHDGGWGSGHGGGHHGGGWWDEHGRHHGSCDPSPCHGESHWDTCDRVFTHYINESYTEVLYIKIDVEYDEHGKIVVTHPPREPEIDELPAPTTGTDPTDPTSSTDPTDPTTPAGTTTPGVPTTPTGTGQPGPFGPIGQPVVVVPIDATTPGGPDLSQPMSTGTTLPADPDLDDPGTTPGDSGGLPDPSDVEAPVRETTFPEPSDLDDLGTPAPTDTVPAGTEPAGTLPADAATTVPSDLDEPADLDDLDTPAPTPTAPATDPTDNIPSPAEPADDFGTGAPAPTDPQPVDPQPVDPSGSGGDEADRGGTDGDDPGAPDHSAGSSVPDLAPDLDDHQQSSGGDHHSSDSGGGDSGGSDSGSGGGHHDMASF